MTDEKQKKQLPSEQLMENYWDITVTDMKGRKLRLKNPSFNDHYELLRVLGADSEIKDCRNMAEVMLHVAQIDDHVLSRPTSYREYRAVLEKIGFEGMAAVTKHAAENAKNDKEAEEQIKK
jgi:hypothetical protein